MGSGDVWLKGVQLGSCLGFMQTSQVNQTFLTLLVQRGIVILD